MAAWSPRVRRCSGLRGDQCLPMLGHLQDVLPEECHAGPSRALALQEFQPMDLAFGDAV